ncbi:MAG: dihydroorotase [Bacteroidaceae bacterium]|nr:dihydroorotase [Bacteroidaceae bacterium]
MSDCRTVIENVTVVNEGERYRATVVIENDRIAEVERLSACDDAAAEMLLLPGIIDGHVHMREPGLTHKATMESETRAAARGGVTTVLDMPNVVPQTTSLQLLQERYNLAQKQCHVNYGFYLGASNNNLDDIRNLDAAECPGVKLFMGSSTGGMLVEKEEKLRSIFHSSPSLIMAHCEDTARINAKMAEVKQQYGDDPDVRFHPIVRDHEACYQSTALAVRLAKEEGARLHVAHITTARELELFEPNDEKITAEVCVPHLLFTQDDYKTLGTRIKCNPAIKSAADRDALRKALTDGRVRTIGTDHAPHLLKEKEGGCCKAMSGMPMVQFSLPAMLGLAEEGILGIERLVELMCHNPARLYGIKERGFIRKGYKADLTLVRKKPWAVTGECIESLCAWSPLEGKTFDWQVEKTWVNGQLAWDGTTFPLSPKGEKVLFDKSK